MCTKFAYVELGKVVVEGVRKTPMEKKDLEELAASIARHDVLQRAHISNFIGVFSLRQKPASFVQLNN